MQTILVMGYRAEKEKGYGRGWKWVDEVGQAEGGEITVLYMMKGVYEAKQAGSLYLRSQR
jgi:hypothetical protein